MSSSDSQQALCNILSSRRPMLPHSHLMLVALPCLNIHFAVLISVDHAHHIMHCCACSSPDSSSSHDSHVLEKIAQYNWCPDIALPIKQSIKTVVHAKLKLHWKQHFQTFMKTSAQYCIVRNSNRLLKQGPSQNCYAFLCWWRAVRG